MRAKQGKRVWVYICLTASAIAASISASSAVKADDGMVLERLRPMYALEDASIPAVNQRIRAVAYFSEKNLFGIPQKYVNWMAADFLMVLVHETGHYGEASAQKLDPSIMLQQTPFWINGRVDYGPENRNKKDCARIAIAGFVAAGNLAESLKRDIFLGNVPKESLRFMSMLALASELNLPFYLGQHYAETAPDNSNDIESFSQNTGISPKTMTLSSGIHMLVNAPYMCRLVKNAFGPSPTAPEKKDYFVSFRYNGDSYMLTFHSDLI